METEKDKELWKIAKKRVGFKRHLATYIVINLMFWAIWFISDYKNGNTGFPWPIFPMIGWGIGLTFNFLGAYVFSDKLSVEKEFEKLKNK
jgi:hypothetical protein